MGVYGSKITRYDGQGYMRFKKRQLLFVPDAGCRDLYGGSDGMTYHVLYVYLACVLK